MESDWVRKSNLANGDPWWPLVYLSYWCTQPAWKQSEQLWCWGWPAHDGVLSIVQNACLGNSVGTWGWERFIWNVRYWNHPFCKMTMRVGLLRYAFRDWDSKVNARAWYPGRLSSVGALFLSSIIVSNWAFKAPWEKRIWPLQESRKVKATWVCSQLLRSHPPPPAWCYGLPGALGIKMNDILYLWSSLTSLPIRQPGVHPFQPSRATVRSVSEGEVSLYSNQHN